MTAAPSFHPIANLFPLIKGAEFDELVSDVKANGLREPIVLHPDGRVLDGRNRFRACTEAGVEPQYVTYEGDDPVAYAISLNLRRRHLSESQRSLIAASISNLGNGERASQVCEAVTREKAAELLNVSPRSVDSARVVRDRGAPELQEKVAAGELSISAAADVATLPVEEQVEVVARGEKEILAKAKEIRGSRAVAQREKRLENIAEIARGNAALDTGIKYPIILADPPWRYAMGVTDRAIENHYPTLTLEEICALPVADLATPDAVLFLWVTSPKLADSWAVLDAWGFTYRTSMVWVKDKIGMGYWARQQHELLLIATRGEMPPPAPSARPASVIMAPRGEHSAKPVAVHEFIERAYPNVPRIELFARRARKGWAAWGNQAPEAVAEGAPEAGNDATGGEVIEFPQRVEIATTAATVAEPEALATPAQRMLERIRCLTEAAGTFETTLPKLTGDELAEVQAALAAVAGLQHAIDRQNNARRLKLTGKGRPARKAAAKQKGDAA